MEDGLGKEDYELYYLWYESYALTSYFVERYGDIINEMWCRFRQIACEIFCYEICSRDHIEIIEIEFGRTHEMKKCAKYIRFSSQEANPNKAWKWLRNKIHYFMQLVPRIEDFHKSEWKTSKHLETLELELVNGNLICFPSWHFGHLTWEDVLLQEIKQLETNLLKTRALR